MAKSFALPPSHSYSHSTGIYRLLTVLAINTVPTLWNSNMREPHISHINFKKSYNCEQCYETMYIMRRFYLIEVGGECAFLRK